MENARLLCLADAAQHISRGSATAPSTYSTSSSPVLPRPGSVALPRPYPSLPAATSWDQPCLAPFEPRTDISLPPISSFLSSSYTGQVHSAIHHTRDADILRSFTPSPKMSPASGGSSGYASPLMLPQPSLRLTTPTSCTAYSPRASPIPSRQDMMDCDSDASTPPPARIFVSPTANVDVSGQCYLPSPHPSPNLRANDRESTSDSVDSYSSDVASKTLLQRANVKAGNVTRRRRRPPFSYASLIAQAILSAPSRQLTLRDIYQWLMDRYPTLYRADDSSWQNTIRHNLSLNKCFCKAPRQSDETSPLSNKGKGGYWCINDMYLPLFRDGQWQRATDLEPETGRQVAGLLRVRGGVPRKHSSSITAMPKMNAINSVPALTPSSPITKDIDMRRMSMDRQSTPMQSPSLSPCRTPVTPPMSLTDIETVHSTKPTRMYTPENQHHSASFRINHLLN